MLHRHSETAASYTPVPVSAVSIIYYIFLDRNTGVYLNYYFYSLSFAMFWWILSTALIMSSISDFDPSISPPCQIHRDEL